MKMKIMHSVDFFSFMIRSVSIKKSINAKASIETGVFMEDIVFSKNSGNLMGFELI